MSSAIGEMLKAIRNAEGLSQTKFAEITGISISTIKKYETGVIEPGGNTLLRVTRNEIFKKYTMWLMTGETNEAAGQISPALSPNGRESTLTRRKQLKTG
ncbi:helix-turn-helix domain-containing protein [Edwardsiella piscicida]|uniref:helix-turn-helix domain-containing protein n=1 Tax=Edwardsiella piscicida TaxID=1263550 RepID=UPI00370DA6BB